MQPPLPLHPRNQFVSPSRLLALDLRRHPHPDHFRAFKNLGARASLQPLHRLLTPRYLLLELFDLLVLPVPHPLELAGVLLRS